MTHTIAQLQAEFARNYKQNLELSVGDNTPFAILMQQLNTKFKDKTLTGKEQTAQLTQGLLTMAQAIYNASAQGAWTVIQLALNNEIANAELGLKAQVERAKQGLLNAQEVTERKKPALITQQIAQLGADERTKLLNAIGQIIFGYATGGVDVPTGLQGQQYNAWQSAYNYVQTKM